MPEAETAVVYVVSPDREEQLFRSLDSLLTSGSDFDAVRIYCVGLQPGRWRFTDSRISVQTVPPLFGKYFFGNKLHLCDTPARRVIFLDSDTLVLRPLEHLWKDRAEHVLGRRGTAMSWAKWDHTVWRALFTAGGFDEVPMFNAGVLLFQSGAHRRVKNSWYIALERFLSGGLPAPWPSKRISEQCALSVAIAHEGLSFGELSPKAHAFGWQKESREGATVFHYGNHLYTQLHSQLAPLNPGMLKEHVV
jgi:hypothetical protein